MLGQENASNVDLAKLGADLRSRYQQDFITQWRAFLRSGNVVHYSGLPDASQKLLKTFRQSVSAAGAVLRGGTEHGG